MITVHDREPLPFTRPPKEWRFLAAMNWGQSPIQRSVRLGTVTARTENEATTKVELFFLGGYFYPNQIAVWPVSEELVIK